MRMMGRSGRDSEETLPTSRAVGWLLVFQLGAAAPQHPLPMVEGGSAGIKIGRAAFSRRMREDRPFLGGANQRRWCS